MPLHLLGKKSWNVYNKSNIEKVRRDEAIAKAAEEAEEERMQALDAERRMQILRGEEPTAISFPDIAISGSISWQHHSERPHREKRLRKKTGENDTEFEMRVASQKAEEAAAARNKSSLTSSMIPHNISDPRNLPKRNVEAEREAAEKKREYEDQYTMRFSNAAGFKQSPGESPWYSKGNRLETRHEKDITCSKDVWGNDDPGRVQRENMRMVSNDPLVMMKAGASKVRELERREKKKLRARENHRRHLDRDDKKSLRGKRDVRDYEDNDIKYESLDNIKTEHKRDRRRESLHKHRHRDRIS